jgi:hypothetical protein
MQPGSNKRSPDTLSLNMPVPCQVCGINNMAQNVVPLPMGSLRKRLELVIHRRLNPTQKRAIKRHIANLIDQLTRIFGGHSPELVTPTTAVVGSLTAGDRVRVRTRDEIVGTLSRWGELKGLSFMPEMEPFCGTEQRVLKSVQRFLDERDYKVKKTSGVILLDGVMCEGTEFFGPCDRSCFFFWREEWLEKID